MFYQQARQAIVWGPGGECYTVQHTAQFAMTVGDLPKRALH